MVLKVQIFWTCLVVTFVFCAESHCLQKVLLPKNWGPQSMLYLKGKYGRRFIPDSEVDFYQSALRRLYSVIRDFERLKSRQMRRWTRLFTAQNLMIRYTQET